MFIRDVFGGDFNIDIGGSRKFVTVLFLVG